MSPGRLDELLRALDRRYLPRAVDALRRLRSGPLPSLRRLDQRFASSGPLALLRDVPQLGAVLCAVLVVAGGLTVLSRSGISHSSGPADASLDSTDAGTLPGETGSGFVGAEPGAAVATYLTDARARLAELARRSPGSTVYALVDLRGYVSADAAARTLGDVTSVRAFFRPQVPGQRTETDNATVTNLAADLPRAYAAEAKVLTAAAGEFRRLADSITGTSKDERQFKASYLAEAKLRLAEAHVLTGRCDCVFAVVVRATPKALAALASTPGVRAVDPAPRGAALAELEFGPLPPDVTKVVPQSTAAGAP